MSALDRLIEKAAVQLDLGYRARSVVDVMLGWINAHPLGLDGLEQQFEQAGLGPRFRQWRTAPQAVWPIAASELERAIGMHAIVRMARRAAMPPGTFRVVACHLLPELIRLLPHSGPVPLVPRASRPHLALQRRHMTSLVPSPKMYGMALRGMLWVLAALAVIALSGWALLKMRQPLWVSAPATVTHEGRLSLQQHGAHVEVQGRLPREADRRAAWNTLVALYGRPQLRGGIVLDPAADAPAGLSRLLARLPQLAGDGLRLQLQGGRLQVDTAQMDEPQRLAVSGLLRRDFADLQVTGLWGPGLAALAQLPAQPGADPGAHTALLLDALNQTRLDFPPGSSVLKGDSHDTLQAVAAALRATPAGTRVEVGVHTDGRGSSEANLHLSQQRADTVVAEMVQRGVPPERMLAVGHGQAWPLADNRQDAGRARNRRVTYTVVDADRAADQVALRD